MVEDLNGSVAAGRDVDGFEHLAVAAGTDPSAQVIRVLQTAFFQLNEEFRLDQKFREGVILVVRVERREGGRALASQGMCTRTAAHLLLTGGSLEMGEGTQPTNCPLDHSKAEALGCTPVLLPLL